MRISTDWPYRNFGSITGCQDIQLRGAVWELESDRWIHFVLNCQPLVENFWKRGAGTKLCVCICIHGVQMHCSLSFIDATSSQSSCTPCRRKSCESDADNVNVFMPFVPVAADKTLTDGITRNTSAVEFNFFFDRVLRWGKRAVSIQMNFEFTSSDKSGWCIPHTQHWVQHRWRISTGDVGFGSVFCSSRYCPHARWIQTTSMSHGAQIMSVL